MRSRMLSVAIVLSCVGTSAVAQLVADPGVVAASSVATCQSNTFDPAKRSNPPIVETPADPVVTLERLVLRPGEGIGADVGDELVVCYVLVDSATGRVIDHNYGGPPFRFVLGEGTVIEGWERGLIGVQAGSQVQLDIPSARLRRPVGR